MAIDFSDIGGKPVNEAGGGIDFSDIGGQRVGGSVPEISTPPSMLDRAKTGLMDYLQKAAPIASKAASYAVNPASAVNDVVQNVAANPRQAYDRYGKLLPAAGAVIGSGLAPGIGTAAGAGLGEIARQATGIAVGDPKMQAITPIQAGTSAALQSGMAGVGEVNAIARATGPTRPYLDRGIGYAAEKLAPIGQGIKRGVAAVQEAFTGAPARSAVKLIDNPETLVTTVGQVGPAGKAVEAAESGLANKIAPEIEAKITTNQGGYADKIVTDLMEASRTVPDAINTQDAIAGIKAIDRTIPAPTRSNAAVLQKYYDLRSQLADIVSKNEPDYAAAKTAYSEAKSASNFRNVFPRTKTGNVSTVKTVLPMLLDYKRAAALPVTSPVVWGTGMAAGSTLAKGAAFAIQNPTARRSIISAYIAGRGGQGQ